MRAPFALHLLDAENLTLHVVRRPLLRVFSNPAELTRRCGVKKTARLPWSRAFYAK
jgi:hypothetical protein